MRCFLRFCGLTYLGFSLASIAVLNPNLGKEVALIRRTKELWEQHVISRLSATSIPIFIVGLLGSFVPLLVEPKILESKLVSWEWFLFRVLYNGGLITIAYWRSHLPDTIQEKLFGESKKWWKKWIAGGLTLSIYRLPLYSSLALIFGFHWFNVLKLCGIYASENLAFGLVYIWINDWCRQKYSKKLQIKQP